MPVLYREGKVPKG